MRCKIIMVLACLAQMASAQTTYNFQTSLPTAGTNPNGPWSLRYGNDLLPFHYYLPSESAWVWDWNYSTVPSFAIETLTKWNDCQPGDIVMQGAFTGSPKASIVWTAPANGVITISGRTWDAYGNRGGTWSLVVGGTQVASGTIVPNSKRTSGGVTFGENVLAGLSLSNLMVQAGTEVAFLQESASAAVEYNVTIQPTSDLIAWWPGDGSCTNLAGSEALSLRETVGYTNGVLDQAFNLGGAGYLQLQNPVLLPVGAAPRTMTVWFKTPQDLANNTESGIVQYGTPAYASMFGLITSGNAPGKLYFYGHSADLAGTTTLQPNTWYFAAVTYDGAIINLYLNNHLEASGAFGLNTIMNPDGFTAGCRNGGPRWQGQLDEITLWNRALSTNELQSIAAGMSKSPRLAVQRGAAGTVSLAWPAVVGKSYQLQYNQDVASTNWSNIGAPWVATNSSLVVTNAITNQHGFFRLLVP